MGDILRQLFYPLLLPAIVFCVWMNAWASRQDSTSRGRKAPPPQVLSPLPSEPDPVVRRPSYTMMREDDGVATTDEGTP